MIARKHYWKILVLAIFLLKLFTLFLTSHPFDFAAYVYQSRSFFDYGINPLFYWNKGAVLLALFVCQYSIYTVFIDQFGLMKDNVFLLHFFYKLPFLILDLATGYLIAQIVLKTTNNKRLSKLSFVAWSLNPLIFWTVSVHGQYGILATFFVTLSLLLLIQKKLRFAFAVLALGASVYYYPLIFLPFYLIYVLAETNWKFKKALYCLLSFIGTLILAYIPFILHPHLIKDIAGSLLHHAAPDAPELAQVVNLPNFSLYKFPYRVVTGSFPTNLSAPIYLKGVSLMIVTAAVAITGYFIHRIRHVSKTRQYTFASLLKDMLIVLIIFFVLIGKMQVHYLVWLFPLLLIYGILVRSYALITNYFLIGIIAIVLILCGNNLGIFFLDAIPWGTVNVNISQSTNTLALGGFCLMLLVASVLFMLKKRQRRPNLLVGALVATALLEFYLLISIILLSVMGPTLHPVKNSLASTGSVYTFSFKPKSMEEENLRSNNDPVFIPDHSFESIQPESTLISSGYLNSQLSPWSYYNLGEAGSASVSVTKDEAYSGERSLRITTLKDNASGQINMGAAPIGGFLPISQKRLYTLSANLLTKDFYGGKIRLALRYRDVNGDVIPGSDESIAESDNAIAWTNLSKDFSPSSTAAYYIEPLLTFSQNNNDNFQRGAQIYLDVFRLIEKREKATIKLQHVTRTSNLNSIESDIITNPSAQPFFKFRVNVKPVAAFTTIESASFNTCEQTPTPSEDFFEFDFAFDASCYQRNGENEVTIRGTNFTEQPKTEILLSHEELAEAYAPDKKIQLYTIFAFALPLDSILIFATFKRIRDWSRK